MSSGSCTAWRTKFLFVICYVGEPHGGWLLCCVAGPRVMACGASPTFFESCCMEGFAQKTWWIDESGTKVEIKCLGFWNEYLMVVWSMRWK
jgi:hypothetical protein